MPNENKEPVTVTKEVLAESLNEVALTKATELVRTEIEKLNPSIEKINTDMIEVKQKLTNLPMEIKTSIEVKEEKQFTLGRLLRAKMTAAMEKKPIADVLKRWEDLQHNCTNAFLLRGLEQKNMTAWSLEDGGLWLGEDWDSEIIPIIRSKSIVREAGARVVTLPKGGRTFRRNTSGTTMYWKGEGKKITKSSLKIGFYKMTGKEMGGEVIISNKLLRLADISADAEVQRDLMAAAAYLQDIAFIAGTGTEYQPSGILKWTPAAYKFTMTATPDTTKISNDLLKCIQLLETANMDVSSGTYLMHPTQWWGIAQRETTTNQKAAYAQTLLDNNMLFGFPVKKSTNVTSGKIIFALMEYMLIGEILNMQFDFFPNGTYTDDNGDTISGIETDESVLRLLHEVDFLQKYDSAASVIEGVTWGA